MKSIYKVLTFIACVGVFGQCADDGEYDHPINRDNIPDVPVLFPGATTFGANPYYQVTFQGGAAPITIQISVPDDAPLKIREITKMIAGTTSITPLTLGTATTANYLPGPVAVNGTSATITTSLTEFNAKMPTATDVTTALVNTAAAATPPTYVERAFMFLLTLEDGSTVVTQQVRLRVVK